MARGRGPLSGLLIVIALVLLSAGAVWYLDPIAPIATGYAAKTVCSGTYLSDRSQADVEGDLPPNPLVPLLRTTVDDSEGGVRTTLMGACASTAYVSAYGCTLADQRTAFAAFGATPEPDRSVPWPRGEGPATLPDGVDPDEVDDAIAIAFTEDDPEGRLVGDRRLSLDDDTLRDDGEDQRADITLGQLLAMTSGLAFEEVYDPGTDATGRDWARFGQWYLQNGEWGGKQLLPDDWVSYTTTPVQLQTDDPYGAHWWLNAGPSGELRMPSVPSDAYWASGNEGQQVVVIPSEDLVVVRLGFSGTFSGVEWGLEPLLVGIIGATGR